MHIEQFPRDSGSAVCGLATNTSNVPRTPEAKVLPVQRVALSAAKQKAHACCGDLFAGHGIRKFSASECKVPDASLSEASVQRATSFDEPGGRQTYQDKLGGTGPKRDDSFARTPDDGLCREDGRERYEYGGNRCRSP